MPVLNRALLSTYQGVARLPHQPSDRKCHRIAQFGTGAFLRGFIAPFVQDAVKEGRFGGDITVIGQTGSGRSNALEAQDGLFTLVTDGVDADGELRSTYEVLSVIRQAWSVHAHWNEIMDLFAHPELTTVVSNTTEVGLRLDPEDRTRLPIPLSFPARLTALLAHRAACTSYASSSGIVYLPCELVEGNGELVRSLVLSTAGAWGLPEAFAAWIREACLFVNTLVDRIVPGKPSRVEHIERLLGYRDDLLTSCESYRFFALEGSRDALLSRVPWLAHPDIVITPDLTGYRERKVRLLNATHTLLAPLAQLSGMRYVHEALLDETLGAFVTSTMEEDIAPMIPLPRNETLEFAQSVGRRFLNPNLKHEVQSITLQQTMKQRVRVLPILQYWAEKGLPLPDRLVAGCVAGWLTAHPDLGIVREPDEALPRFGEHAAHTRSLHGYVQAILEDTELWQTPLRLLPGLPGQVTCAVSRFLEGGVPALCTVSHPA